MTEIAPGTVIYPKGAPQFRGGFRHLTVQHVNMSWVHFFEPVPALRIERLLKIASLEPDDRFGQIKAPARTEPVTPPGKSMYMRVDRDQLSILARAALRGAGFGSIDLNAEANAVSEMERTLRWL